MSDNHELVLDGELPVDRYSVSMHSINIDTLSHYAVANGVDTRSDFHTGRRTTIAGVGEVSRIGSVYSAKIYEALKPQITNQGISLVPGWQNKGDIPQKRDLEKLVVSSEQARKYIQLLKVRTLLLAHQVELDASILESEYLDTVDLEDKELESTYIRSSSSLFVPAGWVRGVESTGRKFSDNELISYLNGQAISNDPQAATRKIYKNFDNPSDVPNPIPDLGDNNTELPPIPKWADINYMIGKIDRHVLPWHEIRLPELPNHDQ